MQDEVERKLSSILANNDWSDAGHNNRVFELTGFLHALCAMIRHTRFSDRRGRALFVQHCVDNMTEFMKSEIFLTSVSLNVRELWGEIMLCKNGENVMDTSEEAWFPMCVSFSNTVKRSSRDECYKTTFTLSGVRAWNTEDF